MTDLPAKRTAAVIGQLLVGLVMAFFLITGFSKLVDINDFIDALRTWKLLPSSIVPTLALVVPAVEVTIGGLWLAGHARPHLAIGGLAFLIAVSGAFAVHLAVGAAPRCGCLGVIAKIEGAQHWAEAIFVRNALLFFIMGAGIALSSPLRHRRDNPRTPGHRPRPDSPGRCARRAYTLLELLTTVALIGILLSLLLPSLATFRLSVRATRSNVHLHQATFSIYNNDYADYMPFLTDPEATYTIVQSGSYRKAIVYFQLASWWNIALADQYYGKSHLNPAFRFPGTDGIPWTSYLYSQTFLADPAFWRDTTRTGPEQWRATGAWEVLFSARKALLVDSDSERVRRRDPSVISGSPVGVAFVDGSVRDVKLWAFLRGYPKKTGQWPGSYNSIFNRGMHTIDGVRGRDVP